MEADYVSRADESEPLTAQGEGQFTLTDGNSNRLSEAKGEPRTVARMTPNRTLDLSGREDNQSRGRPPHLRVANKTAPCTILLPQWNDVHLLDQLLDRHHQFSYLAQYERTPYDVVHIGFWRGKNEWILGSNAKTGKLWAHCKMPGGHGVIVRLSSSI
jgi:hypothetical protein